MNLVPVFTFHQHGRYCRFGTFVNKFS